MRGILPRRGEPSDARETDEEGERSAGGGALSAGPGPFDEDDEERADADEQRSKARGDKLLGPDDGAVATEEEEGADEGIKAPLASGGQGGAVKFQEGEEKSAGKEEAGRRHQEGRHGLDAYADGEVGAAPH